MLWIEPMPPFHGDFVGILVEELADPAVACHLVCQVLNHSMQSYTWHRGCHVSFELAPVNDGGLLCVVKQLLAFMSDGCRFATMQAIGDGGGGDTELFRSVMKICASVHSIDHSL